MNNPPTPTTKTAILYARVSTGKQAEQGLSIDSQIEQGRAKAKALGAEVVREFIDEGLSGRTDKRAAFQDAMEYCHLMTPDYLIMWSTSRFFRNKMLAAMYKSQLEKLGVQWVYTSVDLGAKDDASWMTEGIFEMFDEWASRVNASSTKASMIKNARAGNFNGGVVPFGYESKPDPTDKHRKKLCINAQEATLAQKIFALKLRKGMGARMIAAHLNDEGKTYRGKKWTKGVIANLLKSHAVMGQTLFNRKDRHTGRLRPQAEWVVVDSHPAIIDRAVWDQVQTVLGDQHDNCQFDDPRSPFVLSSLLSCGKCGAKMTIESAKGRNRRYHYYVCTAARYDKTHKTARYNADEMDNWILESICSAIFTPDNLQDIISEIKLKSSSWGADIKLEQKEIKKDIAQIARRLQNLYEVLELMGVDAPNLKDMSERIPELKQQRAKCESRLKELDKIQAPKLAASIDDVKIMQNFLLEIIKTAPPIKVKKFLRTFINRINVGNHDVNIEYNPTELLQTNGAVRQNCVWLPGAGSNHRQGD